MNRAEHSLWWRFILTLVAVFWVGSATKSVNAMGCHHEERPAFGLTRSIDPFPTAELLRADFPNPIAHYVPLPCTSFLPSRANARIGAEPLSLNLTAEVPPMVTGDVRFAELSLVTEVRVANRIDRPPRLA